MKLSPDIIAVGVFTIVGTLLGVVVGAVIERLLRLWGRVRCEASVLSRTLVTTDPNSEDYDKEVSWDSTEATEADSAYCVFALDLFNGLEVPTALQNTRVVLVLSDGARMSSRVTDLGTTREGTLYPHVPVAVGAGVDDLEVLNLPPRQIVHKKLRGEFGKEAVDALKTGRWKRIMFEAQRPKCPLLWRKTYRKTITEP